MQVMDRAEVMRWRKAERNKLIGERLATPSEIRRRHTDKIVSSLEEVIPQAQGLMRHFRPLGVMNRRSPLMATTFS
jgi:hypothetical protein